MHLPQSSWLSPTLQSIACPPLHSSLEWVSNIRVCVCVCASAVRWWRWPGGELVLMQNTRPLSEILTQQVGVQRSAF